MQEDPGQLTGYQLEIIKSCVYSRPLRTRHASLFPSVLWPVTWRGKWVCPQKREGKVKYSSAEKNKRILMSHLEP